MNRGSTRVAPGGSVLARAGVPGANNWVPIGPSVVRKGQPSGAPPVGGRVARLAIAPGGSLMYAACAAGGVWRSDDAGASWKPTMDGFDVDPAVLSTTSNCCGAIAIDPADPKRVYVGTGEGDVDELFDFRILGALPAYRGVGAIRSDDGGGHWASEPVDAGSPTLMGAAFFELAVDPGDREHVLAATNAGLYRRVPDGSGGFHWTLVRANKHTSVVACNASAGPVFFAAERGAGVFTSVDGATWSAVGSGFPSGCGRIALGVRQQDPGVLYALCASGDGKDFLQLVRIDGGAGAWMNVSPLPDFGQARKHAASYNIAIAVDPNDASTVYLGGAAPSTDTDNAALYRGAVTGPASGAFALATTYIGNGVHGDIHALVHEPGDSATLFLAGDGGICCTQDATGTSSFSHRNTGLANLCCEAFAQHPTELAVALVALQDNGTARYTGEEAWMHVANGDGGTPVINWADPRQVMCKRNAYVATASDGAQSNASLTLVPGAGVPPNPKGPSFGAPIATTPYNPAQPADAGVVAIVLGVGARFGCDVHISTSFGAALAAPAAILPERITAMSFASAARLFVGTVQGQVHRLDLAGGAWTTTRLDLLGGASPLGVWGVILDIEVDPADATRASVYVVFAGVGSDTRHVWHFDGTRWSNRSGTGATALLNVSHNALVADRDNPSDLYVATDVGVWRSVDSGTSWTPMQNGLPDAAVFDLQMHPTKRILRASTHGRGMYEYDLDATQRDVEVYVRDTALDVGRASTVDGVADPETWPADIVLHYLSRNIKVDVPGVTGQYQTPASTIDFLTFNETIVDGSTHVATADPAAATVVNRVYVEVHNRGVVVPVDNSVKVTLLIADASLGLPSLPAGYASDVVNGTPLAGAWQTAGVATLSDVRNNFPRVAAFDVPSPLLPPPASLPGQGHWCALAIAHSAEDPFANAETNADALTIVDPKVAQRNFEVVALAMAPRAGEGAWAKADVHGLPDGTPKEIVIDARKYGGELGILLPHDLRVGKADGMTQRDDPMVERWARAHLERLEKLVSGARADPAACRRMQEDLRNLLAKPGPFLRAEAGERKTFTLRGVQPEPGRRYPLFLYFEPAATAADARVHVVKRDEKTHRVEGGCSYAIVIRPGS